MNKLVPHLAWLAAVAGAFAAGKFLAQPASGPDAAGLARTTGPTVGDSAGQASTRQSLPDAMAPSNPADDAASFIDKFRVKATGRLNENGMRDAVTAALQESDPVKSSLMFAMLMEELTPENAPAAREAIAQRVTGFDSFRYLGLLNYKWGAIDGEGAVAAAQESGDRREQFMGTAMALSGWGSADPDAALAWMEAQEAQAAEGGEDEGGGRGFDRGPGRDMWMRSLISGLAGSDPAKATELALESAADDPNSARGYGETIAREFLKGGTASAEQWMNSLDDPNLKQGALQAIGEHMARLDPADAATWVSQYADTEGADRIVGDIVQRWADDNPQDALGWVTSLGESDSKNQGMREVFNEWSRSEPTEASQYLATMTDGASKDYAITGLVQATLRQEPESALPWAQAIADPELRDQTVIRAGSEWFRRDQEAAAAWMADSNLTPEVQEAIITPPQRGDRGFGGFGGFGGGGGPGGRRGR